MRGKISAKNLVSISLILAISVLCPISCIAESVQNLQPCVDNTCFKKPTDVAIASDSSFVIVLDLGDGESTKAYLRKFKFPLNSSSKDEIIFLNQNSTKTSPADISLSKNNKFVSVYTPPSEDGNTLIQIINLQSGEIKELKSVGSSGLEISLPAFIDSEGSTLIAGTLNSVSPELVIIDTGKDEVIKRIKLPDLAQSLRVSPNFKSVIVTYSNVFAQSVSIYDLQSNTLLQSDLDPSLAFSVDDFLGRIGFDFFESKVVLSSLGGNHVVHLYDIKSNKVTSQILDRTLEGQTLSTISPDGRTTISIGSTLDNVIGFKIYKSNVLKDGSISLASSLLFGDGSAVLDVGITPDQSKVLILVLRDNKKLLKILNLRDLSKISELAVADDSSESLLFIDPNGQFVITANSKSEPSTSLISDLNPGPVLKSIIPNFAPLNISTPFVINTFIDPENFAGDLMVCFRSNQFCSSSLSISRDLETITGLTPKFSDIGFESIILSVKTKDGSVIASKYDGIFQFGRDDVIVDTFPPQITIFAPSDLALLNTRRVLVLGKVNGTGSGVNSVLVNGKIANLVSEGQISNTSFNFVHDLQFTSDGTFEIKVSATDKANNSAEKTIKVTLDTQVPSVSANVETIGQNQFQVTGSVNGTGSSVASVFINSSPIEFIPGEQISFSGTSTKSPVVVTVSDKAGNKNELTIQANIVQDKVPPVISISTPLSGQIVNENPNTQISFSVTDDKSVKEVFLNGSLISPTSGNSYLSAFTLKPGENLISITAIDTNDNKSQASIKVTFISQEITQEPAVELPKTGLETQEEKEVITLPSEIENLNNSLIGEFSKLTSPTGELLDIGSALSIEISNPPPIPEGAEADIELPQVEGLGEPTSSDESQEIPKGFSFATDVLLKDEVKIMGEGLDKQNTAVLVDSAGRTFVVGFGFLTNEENNNTGRTKNKKFLFQTDSGENLKLTTTLTVPGDATEGDATISVLNKNQSLATVPLNIKPQKDVKVGKKVIGKPTIKDPVKAQIKKSGKELVLKIKGKNFVSRIATIDGKLQKLLNKAQFFTNVTFVPQEGITIKKFKLLKNKITLVVELSENIEPGVKLFNVITPKGADIGAIVFPDPIVDGKIETTTSPVSLILE